MSDLHRLFRLKSTPWVEPMENFTTVALAIAIGHDDRPIKQALQAVDWQYEGPDGRPARAMCDVAAADIITVTAETQLTLWPVDGIALGYLDLVLHVLDAQQHRSAIWVEVKVDAFESGDQLANYKNHAARQSPSPSIITLGRNRVSPYWPALKWSDIKDAIDSVPNPHYAWVSLREFLVDERIVRPSVPAEPIADASAFIDVIVDVNRRVRDLWPNRGLDWRSDGVLSKSLRKWFERDGEFVVTGGPLRYGLEPAGAGWEWGMVVTTENHQKVPLDTQQMLRDADVGELSQDWVRHTDRFEVLDRRMSLGERSSHDDLVAWFDEGLRQLRDANVLERYLAELAAKRETAQVPVPPTDDMAELPLIPQHEGMPDGMHREGDPFPEDLRRFANEERWTFAKTMPDWPHEYLVRERVDEELFERMVIHIRTNGYEGRFYQKKITYLEEAGLV